MKELVINGTDRLCGSVDIQGSKNAALPILAATLLTSGECVIHNCPDITDVRAALKILKGLGADACLEGNTAVVCAKDADGSIIPRELMEKMRSSVMFLGAILARQGEALICLPGGCDLGERPIDLHIKALKKLGVEVVDVNGCIKCSLRRIRPCRINLLYPSVGATENIMLMCASCGCEVYISGAAKEPEIVDLQNFLNLMGADIRGAGTDEIRIIGKDSLHGCEYSVMPDRIVAATYACAAACGGDVVLKGAESGHIKTVLGALSETGCEISSQNGIRIKSNGYIKPVEMIKTLPYPGFPTDVQPILCSVLSKADGTSKVWETVFENRFAFVSELVMMGADIDVDGCSATIRGVKKLHGGMVYAHDLRGGAALAVAALFAEGTTVIGKAEYIYRGYENISRDLKNIGADITQIKSLSEE
ncbi:MAG: UDP-N-acetylglucosamine 1-carboxyvinyltransferase [Oscillospiraceae bacterium]|nr:UDP-N-acetylglucosamine 1-carboxyvinyltransferase [Oscillospiraceae bacterium]